ncbi:cilia- and flagella-associated protein 43 isoform X1 [Bombyx mandarina]|uniref:Cilia- and flagella-associated protein 43 n=2 Tax=Bombyx mandarina TaxID=7092 RepID=A0A6J2KSW5_BOMMA|nr:cilia- and flagella-associated protein 43 isoform X1 [Bombyx mandarina]
MMESDLVAGFSGFPNYVVSVWSWRTNQRLLCIPTGVVRRKQIYIASRTHMLLCECWREGLIVWEVAQCYKRCLMMRRTKEEKTGWEVSEPPYVDVCWTSDGQLYAIDPTAKLYILLSDGIGMVSSLEWAEDIEGTQKPCMCSFGNGILIYGPDKCLRSLKKSESAWKVVFMHTPADDVVSLVSNSTGDVAAVWTATGLLYKVTGDEDKPDVKLVAFKQRDISKIQLIAPDSRYLATMNMKGVLCVYEVETAKLVTLKYIEGNDISFEASPAEPVLAIYGEEEDNYGLALFGFKPDGLQKLVSVCLTHQIVSHVVFSPTGRELIAAAMSAGHVFIYKVSEDHKLSLVRYVELGRGLADCMLMKVGDAMRAFCLVLFSDKYSIGERIICINADTGKDNKFAGKMQGPYARLIPLSDSDTMVAIPHLSKEYHVLKLAGEKGVTVSVKMGPIIDSGHDIKYFDGTYANGCFLSFGYDGLLVLRKAPALEQYDLKLVASHRYELGIKQAIIDADNKFVVHIGRNNTLCCTCLREELAGELPLEPPDISMFDATKTISILDGNTKNYLDLQEEKKVREEAMDHKHQREELVKLFENVRAKLVELLEENLVAPELHQLSLAEFNLHLENKKERVKQAEKERELIRLETEARIVAQDKVTAWIKKHCWDTMLSPRVKIFAIFSHYQVENFAVLPTQRDNWPELQRLEALYTIEAENESDVFRPWVEEMPEQNSKSLAEVRPSTSGSASQLAESESGRSEEEVPRCAWWRGASTALYVRVPRAHTPQILAYSFLQMDGLHHTTKLNVQNMRLWFNNQFDDLMNLKKREMALVEDRNLKLRFIIEELNKLSDLRGSFHHLNIEIRDPVWRQEEQPEKLIKVEPEECSIEPYISPSQIVIVPPDPGPKDDFKDRALMEMMDGVLEKLWHEEIKKPIPMPQCMLEKDPEHFNEDDLRLMFDYEAKVKFRNEERDKYRKMLHAEYAKIAQLLNEGVVKFNQKVKEMWLTKLKADSVIGQENLNLMRLRRTNLDRVEMAEKLEDMRAQISRYEDEVETLNQELQSMQDQITDCQNTYDSLVVKDKYLDRTFKNHFADLSPIIVDQCYKFFKKRPKWQQRAAASAGVLYELAAAVLLAVKPPLLPPDCLDYYKGVEQLDHSTNMPPVMDEALWALMCKLRRAKIENEIRMRAVCQELSLAEGAAGAWGRGLAARRSLLAHTHQRVLQHRRDVELLSRNKTVQLVLPAGQVEIFTTGHMEDYNDATLIRREDIEKINNVILKVGELKLRMMKKQMDFRKGILSKEWEHAQMKMKLRHMEQELSSYLRLKIPKELQQYLKNKELGYTDEQDYMRMEKEMAASKMSINRILNEQIHRVEELEVKLASVETEANRLEQVIADLNVKVSEKRIHQDPLEPIRIRKVFKERMETLVMRGRLIREVQANHTTIVLLQTELELLRLKTYPTLASFRTFN